MSGERNFKPLFSWRSAICESDLAPTTRHVALTLSLHMNERGGSCFPSQGTLASETGLAVKTVAEHLKILNGSGWLAKKVIRRGEGRGTRVEYSATNPPQTTGGQTTGGLTTGGYDDDQPPFDGTTTPRQTVCLEDDSEGDKRTTVLPDVASDDEGPTAGQLSNVVASALYDKIKADTGKPPVGWTMKSMVPLLKPFFEAGWEQAEVKRALWACHTAGTPISRQSVERHLDGRANNKSRTNRPKSATEILMEQMS